MRFVACVILIIHHRNFFCIVFIVALYIMRLQNNNKIRLNDRSDILFRGLAPYNYGGIGRPAFIFTVIRIDVVYLCHYLFIFMPVFICRNFRAVDGPMLMMVIMMLMMTVRISVRRRVNRVSFRVTMMHVTDLGLISLIIIC